MSQTSGLGGPATSRSDVVSNPFTADLIRRKAAFLSQTPGFTRSEEEDLRQEMALFLMTKQQLFDAGRGSVEAFVTSVVTSWIGMEVRRRKSRKRAAASGPSRWTRPSPARTASPILCPGLSATRTVAAGPADRRSRTKKASTSATSGTPWRLC
ncbi:MAG: hypothetical protein HRU76_01340 [Phycisphaeraceae bacterium]|nr:MAG: hypothetical protein HRU76_01340 [Phycisphaeraceae bacterium]